MPLDRCLELAMTYTRPTREKSGNKLSKAHAIVYKAVPRAEVAESFTFSGC
jgi:hypothetical protein